jgi:ribonucleoside-diphosphate reductase alpha chain
MRPLRPGTWSESALRVLRERYLARDGKAVLETPEEMCWRVAACIAQAEGKYGKTAEQVEAIAQQFYDLMVDSIFLPNSPTLMNAGKENGLQYSACYVLPVGDSMEEIFEAVKAAAIIHKSGGGTGFAFSRLRPKDALVRSTGGRASGPVSFLRVFNGATEAVKQGGTRRGANMGILRVDHPDILEFIESKLDGGITNFNISVAITDRFMEALQSDGEYDLVEPHTGAATGRLRAREVFDRIVQAAWKTGDPGLFFVDRCNAGRANPTPTLDKVEATNPCIAGDSLIATDRGLMRMAELVARFSTGGIAVQVDPRLMPARFLLFEGTHNVPVSSYDHGCLPISRAFCTGERDTVRVRTKAGFELVCTPDHRLMTTRGWVQAGELRVGADQLFIQSTAGTFETERKLPFEVANEIRGRNGRVYRHALPTEWSRDLGLVLGFLVGDGWLRSGDKNCRLGLTFGAGNQALLEELKGTLDKWYGHPVRAVRRGNGVYRLSYHGKFFVDFFERLGVRPVEASAKVVPESLFRAPREAVVGFLQGLFTADGTVRDNPQSSSAWIALTSKSRELLRGVQVLLMQLGIRSQIMQRSRPPRAGVFSYRTRGGAARSYTSDGVLFELGIFGESRDVFRREVGFLNARQERLEGVRYRRFYRQKWTDVVVAVEPNGVQKVYDLTEPQSHTIIASGIVAHQCGEQPLYPNEACNLGSLNLAKFVTSGATVEGIDWAGMERAIRLSVRFLDDVIEVNPYPLPEINEAVKKNRRIGLGVMGWADLLCCLGIPYDSEAALELGDRVMAFIQEKGHDESRRLAEERGPFPTWAQSIYRDKGMLRNSTVTTIAPTGTISIIADCSSGIEPLFAVAFEHRVGERRLSFVNKHFEAIAKARGFSSEALMQKVAERGTLHGLAEVPEDVRRVFITAHEVAPEWHVRHQGVYQRHTDNGVSKTINLPSSATSEDIRNAYLLAYETGCIGITVFRDGCKGTQVLHVGTGAKEQEKAPTAQAAPPAPVQPRPRVVQGVTYRTETPLGTAYITVNHNGQGEPLEVFANVGKVGSETAAVSEAIGRLISLCLRLASPVPAKERVKQIVEQLGGIGGSRHLGFGKERIRSLPDAIAKVLAEHVGMIETEEQAAAQLTLPERSGPPIKVGDPCPECGEATLAYEEGCLKCYGCGFAEC